MAKMTLVEMWMTKINQGMDQEIWGQMEIMAAKIIKAKHQVLRTLQKGIRDPTKTQLHQKEIHPQEIRAQVLSQINRRAVRTKRVHRAQKHQQKTMEKEKADRPFFIGFTTVFSFNLSMFAD